MSPFEVKLLTIVIIAIAAISIILLLTFAPAIIAKRKGHPHTLAIFLLCFVLGWTGLGWIVAMIWALVINGDSAVPVKLVGDAPSPMGANAGFKNISMPKPHNWSESSPLKFSRRSN